PDMGSPLEMKLMGEVAYAAYRLKRENANDLVKTLLKKYEDRLDKPPEGKKFQEVYNVETLKPRPEWLQIYLKMKSELENLGLDFKYAFRREEQQESKK
ncbi:MAG: monomethylamine:corrinoid methyltransferase, partial [Nitrososphaerota archaeon]